MNASLGNQDDNQDQPHPELVRFVDEWRKHFKPKHEWQVGSWSPAVLTSESVRTNSSIDCNIHVPEQSQDLILAEFAWGHKRPGSSDVIQMSRLPSHWVDTFAAAESISDNGFLLSLMPSNALEHRDIQDILSEHGLAVNAVAHFQSVSLPMTSVKPVLFVISRQGSDDLLAADFEAESGFGRFFEFLKNGTSSNSLHEGVRVARSDFRTIDALSQRLQADQLAKHHASYKRVPLSSIAIETEKASRNRPHVLKENTVYISILERAARRAVTDPAEIPTSHEHYIAITLDSSVLAEYVVAFFESELGKSIMSSLAIGAGIRRVKKADLLAVEISTPSKKEQETIVLARKRLGTLASKVHELESELALNPSTASEASLRAEEMLRVVGELSDADQIRAIIRNGESKTVEFKETLAYCLREKKKADYVETSALKTVVAFLNTDGGTLLVGVADDGSIPGIENELAKSFKGSTDHMLLHLRNRIEKWIGREFYTDIDYRVVQVANSPVLQIKCKPASKECFLKGDQFFVRTNPASEELKGPGLVSYLKRRFGGSS